jgi:hypothetical protein
MREAHLLMFAYESLILVLFWTCNSSLFLVLFVFNVLV